MPITISMNGDGYDVAVSPPHGGPWRSAVPLSSATEVLKRLSELGCHSTDVTDALDAADSNWVTRHDEEVRRQRADQPPTDRFIARRVVVPSREFPHSGGSARLESARLLNAHDPSSWPLPVKLVGVGNRIWRLNASRGPAIRVAWKVCALPVAGVFWATGLMWNRGLRRRDRAHAPHG